MRKLPDARKRRIMEIQPIINPRNRLWQRAFLAIFILLGIGLGIQYSYKASGNRSAIIRWRDQIYRIDDEDIYGHCGYPNPPIMVLLLEPFARMPPFLGSLVWFYLKV